MKNRITLFGFYGRKNSGDDAMLYGIIKYLSTQAHSTIVIPTDIEPVLPRIPNEIIIRPRNIKNILRAVKNSDHLLIGGGSLFHTKGERMKFKIMVSRIFVLALWAKTFNCKVSFISAGIGPFDNTFGKAIFKAMLKFTNFMNVRDIKSFQLLQKAKVPARKFSLTEDFVYAIKLPPEIFKTVITDTIAINLLPYYTEYLGEKNNQPILNAFEYLIKHILDKNLAKKVDLICINAEDSIISGDKALLEDLYKLLNDERVHFVPYNKDPLQMISAIKSSKLFITFRYHGIVYANLSGTPCVAINYHTKSEMLIEKLDCKEAVGLPVSIIENPELLLQKVEENINHQHYTPDANHFNFIKEQSFPKNFFS